MPSIFLQILKYNPTAQNLIPHTAKLFFTHCVMYKWLLMGDDNLQTFGVVLKL